jgi:hypothetical protein
MLEIIFETDYLIFEKTAYKNGRCKVSARSKTTGKSLMDYRYKNISLDFSSPYINWENLSCCGGLESDEDEVYLHTAVQLGKKLYAGICLTLWDDDFSEQCKPRHQLPTEQDAVVLIKQLKDSLPDDCTMGQEESDREGSSCRFRYIFVCKNGCISDFINTEDVFSAYERLGIEITDEAKGQINSLCETSLVRFADRNFFDYANPLEGVQLIVTGLLLGYPLESTASLLERDGLSLV